MVDWGSNQKQFGMELVGDNLNLKVVENLVPLYSEMDIQTLNVSPVFGERFCMKMRIDSKCVLLRQYLSISLVPQLYNPQRPTQFLRYFDPTLSRVFFNEEQQDRSSSERLNESQKLTLKVKSNSNEIPSNFLFEVCDLNLDINIHTFKIQMEDSTSSDTITFGFARVLGRLSSKTLIKQLDAYVNLNRQIHIQGLIYTAGLMDLFQDFRLCFSFKNLSFSGEILGSLQNQGQKSLVEINLLRCYKTDQEWIGTETLFFELDFSDHDELPSSFSLLVSLLDAENKPLHEGFLERTLEIK